MFRPNLSYFAENIYPAQLTVDEIAEGKIGAMLQQLYQASLYHHSSVMFNPYILCILKGTE